MSEEEEEWQGLSGLVHLCIRSLLTRVRTSGGETTQGGGGGAARQ